MNKRRIILIICGLLLLIAIGWGIYVFMQRGGPNASPEPTEFPGTQIPLQTGSPPSISYGPNPPVSEKIIIPEYEVEINNFYKDAPFVNNQGSAMFVDASDYTFHYEASGNFFIIVIHYEPIAQIRPIAERTFLEKLGISKTEACKIPVRLYVTALDEPLRKGIDYGLSFCPQGRAF